MRKRSKWPRCLVWLGIGCSLLTSYGYAQGSSATNQNLTVVVLVSSTNPTGYNTNPASPGEYQMFTERYLEHLQIPYQLFDVSSAAPPSDLNSRQLIIAGHRALSLSATWQTAIITAVNGGTGFVNLDADPAIGNAQHIRTIFGATGSSPGTPATQVSVPALLIGAGAHYITAMQTYFFGQTSGDLVYAFHTDANGIQQTATSTVLTGATGTVIARLGSDPLILVTTYGTGRAVHFGTLDYLRADRFGFLMGVDDLLWRSVVWAARKPFALRGYPRFWSIAMDHNSTGWAGRVQEMYDPTLTGQVASDGTGGPWKVTSSVFTSPLAPGSGDRASMIADIQAGKLQVSPHGFNSVGYGDAFWCGSCNAGAGSSLTDDQWFTNLNTLLSWQQGNGGSDRIPLFSKWVRGHFHDLSNNVGYDFWNAFKFRYFSATMRPGYQYNYDPNQYGGAERMNVRSFWRYQLPPKINYASTSDEAYAFFFADSVPIGSRAGLPAAPFYVFDSRTLDLGVDLTPPGQRIDLEWCDANGNGVSFDVSKFQWYSWRLMSSLVPVEIYMHDEPYSACLDSGRRQIIQNVSTWLSSVKTRHIFMQDAAEYAYARNASRLTQATYNGSQLSFTFTGSATNPDGNPVPTQVMVFTGDTEAQYQSVPGFNSGSTISLAYPPASNPAPATTSITPSVATSFGPAFALTMNGSGFAPNSVVRWGGADRVTTFISSTQLTASIPASDLLTAGTVLVTVFNPAPGGGSSNGQLFAILAPSGSFIDDFHRPDSAVIGNGWTQKYSPAFFIQNNQVISIDTTSVLIDYHDDIVYRPVSEDQRDVEVGLQFRVLPGQNFPQVHARVQRNTITQTNTLDDYLLFVDGFQPAPGRAIIARQQPVTGQFECYMLAIPFPNPLSPSEQYRLRFQVTGANPVTLTGFVDWFTNGGWQVFAQGTTTHTSSTQRDPSLYCDPGTMPPPLTTAGATGFAKWRTNNETYQQFYWTSLSTATPNPMPSTTSISPSSAGAGTAGFPLTVNGSSFNASSIVRWNGNDRPTTFVSANQLTATISASDIASTGTVLLTVFNPPAGGGTSNPQVFTITPGPPVATRISPPAGPSTGQNILQLHGNGFTADMQVRVGGVLASGFTLLSPNWASVTVPAGTAGSVATVQLSNSNGTSTAPGGYAYLNPSAILMEDSFNGDSTVTWLASPLGLANGWSRVGGAYEYAGIGPTQQYAGNASWTNYTLDAKILLFSLSNYPGGIRGRVNPSTGQCYAVWLYPGSNLMRLFRVAGWSIDTPGIVTLATANMTFDTNYHSIRMIFQGSLIQVYWDGALMISATDTAYSSGMVALDVSNQRIRFEDVLVTTPGTFGTALTGISVTPGSFTLTGSGATQQLTVTANYSDGSAQNVTSNSSTSYTSTNTAVATVNSTGLVTSVAPGTSTITVGYGGFSALSTVTVNQAPTPPSVTRVSPTQGSTAGGNRMDLMGGGLTTSTTVTIGGRNVSVLSVLPDGSRMTVTIPAGALGPADIVVSNSVGSTTLTGGYTYVDPLTILFADDFNLGSLSNWTASPLGLFTNWTAAQDVAEYNGGGPTQIYAGNPGWGDYAVEVKFRLFSTSNYPGGLAGRVNTSTGARYEAWLYPATQQIALLRTAGWSVDTPGLAVLQTVTVANMAPNVFHRLRLVFFGTQVSVIYDGTTVITANDSALTNGAVALDVSNQRIQFDDVWVTANDPTLVLLTGISVTPTSFSLFAGGTQQLTVTARYSDGSTQNVTTNPNTSYTSSNTAVATVNSTGLVSPVANGTATITASYGGYSASATATVNLSAPSVTRVSPTQASTAGGNRMDIYGTNLATSATVTIGGQNAAALSALPDGSRMTVTIPAGALGAANIVVTNAGGSTTLTGGYTYANPLTILFADDFNLGSLSNWTASPLGLFTNWTAAQDVADYNGGGHTQIFAGNPGWTNYSVEAKFQLFSTSNYPGGLAGRVNTSTGTRYEAWLYPATQEIALLRTTGWSVDTPGLAVLQRVTVSNMSPNVFHRLKLVFNGTQISVVYDGTTIITVTDSVLTSGAVVLDVSNQRVQFDDVFVSTQ